MTAVVKYKARNVSVEIGGDIIEFARPEPVPIDIEVVQEVIRSSARLWATVTLSMVPLDDAEPVGEIDVTPDTKALPPHVRALGDGS